MATTDDYDQLRGDLDLTEAAFDNTEAAQVFARAESEYTDLPTAYAQARVIVLRQLKQAANKRVTTKRNEATDNLSDYAKQLAADIAYWEKERDRLDEIANKTAGGTMRWGRPVGRRRVRQFPGGY